MPLFVYVTENCRNDARTHSLTGEVERLQERVEEAQSVGLFDPFPPPYLVKKKFGGRQGRLIADRRPVGDHAVIVFLAILIRGSHAYESGFGKDPIAYGQQHFADLVSDEDLIEFVEEQTASSPIQSKPDPGNAEYALLYGAFEHHQDSAAEDLVCETKEWVEQVSKDRIAKQIALLCKPCLDALSKPFGLHCIRVLDKPGWAVWALRSEGRLLLIVPATDTTEAEAEGTAREVARQLEGADAATVLRASRRAYPAVILADDDLWIDLEREKEANIALSPEESEVLESARRSENPFPLFINGRAGSGKSTILQYLFADLLFHYLSNTEARVMAPPIYLTANGELLRVARTFVERILRNEATFAQLDGVKLVEENRDVLDEAFQEFQPHLLSLLPSDESAKIFPRAARVDYATFRRLWMGRFGKEPKALRDFGPDLSWHVIRSYIKGMSSETYLEPDDYAQLPENQITVTHGAFKLVYDRVWTNWYQGIRADEGRWDDQDLTRHILDNDLAKPIYPAVFCDEAQDFTRLELEMLLRLNLFSNRALPPTDISRVPFAFAGDQFQTLNPTGFRWDAIKASFVEKFIFALDPTRRSERTDLNYRELQYNYRSSYKIVRFSNHVQALRAALFQLPDLKPQTPWITEPKSLPVVWYRANDGAFWKKYRENAGFVVIVPCGEGEEYEYVLADAVLRENVKIEDGIPNNVLSAGRAKGCEYPGVIVYGFGGGAEKDIVGFLNVPAAPAVSDPDKSLPLQYFINRLYVAVSRPKRRLVIVDTDDGFNRLWKCSQDETKESFMLNRVKNGHQVWGPEIEGMIAGSPDDLTRDAAVDPLENARVFEMDGMARNDAFLLKQAAQAYRAGGDIAKSRECRARALEADGELFEAGNAFFEAGFISPEGIRCLWRSGKQGWQRLCDLVATYPQIRNESEIQWAIVLTGRPTEERVAELLRLFARRLQEDKRFSESCNGDSVWRDALSALLQPLFSSQEIKLDKQLADRLAGSLSEIQEKGIKLPARTQALVSFAAQKYAEAIACWEQSGETRSKPYYQAKASTEPYPNRIVWLSKMGEGDKIVEAYSAAPQTALDPEQATIVSSALKSANRLTDAMSLAWHAGVAAPAIDLALYAFHHKDAAVASAALHASLLLLAKQGHWEPLVTLASNLEFAPEKEWKDKSVKEWVKSQADGLQITLVRALAYSDELHKAPAHSQRKLADFLRNFLRVKEGLWKTTLSLAVAGAAFERVGRFTDAIGFYEAVLAEKYFSKERNFARTRWLINKNRQLIYEKSSGSAGKVSEIEHDIRRARAEWRIEGLENAPNYPVLPPLEMPSVPIGVLQAQAQAQAKAKASATIGVPPGQMGGQRQDQFGIVVGHFKIDISRKNSRCNITHAVTLETAFLKFGEGKCEGEGDFRKIRENCWESSSWQLIVEFPRESMETLAIRMKELGISINIEL